MSIDTKIQKYLTEARPTLGDVDTIEDYIADLNHFTQQLQSGDTKIKAVKVLRANGFKAESKYDKHMEAAVKSLHEAKLALIQMNSSIKEFANRDDEKDDYRGE